MPNRGYYIRQTLLRCIILIHLIGISTDISSQDIVDTGSDNHEIVLPINVDNNTQVIDESFYSVPTTRYPATNKIDEFRADSRFKYEKPEAENNDPTWLEDLLLNIFSGIGKFFEVLFSSGILTFIVIVLIVFVVLAIVMKIAKVDMKQVFAKKWKGELSKNEILASENQTIGFDTLIQDALSVGNYRPAIRYLYLRNLKSLSDKNYIIWAENKTNYSYQSEIQNKDIRDRFLATTILFDYIWYGEFPIKEADYIIVENRMNTFNNMITDNE